MPEPLVCEDSDLERLMDTVRSHPGARVLYQDTIRRGGVLGFFAREVHRVAYDVPAPATATLEPAAEGEAEGDQLSFDTVDLSDIAADLSILAATEDWGTPSYTGSEVDGAMADLLASADAIESAVNSGSDAASPEFEALLRKLTTIADLPFDQGYSPKQPAEDDSSTPAERQLSREPLASVPPIEQLASVPPIEQPEAELATVTPFGRPDARNRLELLLQLRQVGVPVSVNPRGEAHGIYQALEEILDELPSPASAPRRAGEVLAIVGESTAAIQAARSCARTLRIPAERIGVAGLAVEEATAFGLRYFSGPADVQRARDELEAFDTPSVVVIATDAATNDPDDPWVGDVVAAMCPTATWAVVDARWKIEDSRAYLDRLVGVDALVVHSAQLSVSPASVWDLDLPLGLLDGRPPTTFAWTGLLLGLLGTDARHRASA